MKVVEISNACELIKKSKLTKMDDKDKFLVIKAIRVLKPISVEYQDFIKDAQEKLKDEEYDANLKEYQDIQKEHPGLKLSEMTIEEINKAEKLAKYFNDSNKRFSDCIEEEANKEKELTYEKISEDAFTKFIASNDFSVEEIVLLQEALCNV